jgi:nucleotide-binding universal stress UspA family protein
LIEEARAGLDELAERLARRNVRARTILLKGMAAHELLFLEEQEKPGLVVMGSHGRTGLARFALGSVADRLVRMGTSPVLIVRSFSQENGSAERALVPLDGSAVAEDALPLVETLAGKPLRFVKLVQAVESPNDVPQASAYLDEIRSRLVPIGIDVVSEVRLGRPSATIEAEAESVDLVIMATHGRGGFDRIRHGSIAYQATRHLAVPVLLVRTRSDAQATIHPATTELAEV